MEFEEEHQGLTDEEIAELRETFNEFDEDQSGFISFTELGKGLRACGLSPTEFEITMLMQQYDTTDDGDGRISFDEFLHMYEDRRGDCSPEKREEELKRAFEEFDTDNNGYVNEKEFRDAMLDFGEDISEDDINQMVGEFDKDGDGRIHYQEFIRKMCTQNLGVLTQ